MNILCWNSRGAACTKFRSTVMDLVRSHHIDVLFVCEPRISGPKALAVIKSLGFSCFEVIDPEKFSGGLWLLWNDAKVKLDIIGTSDQSISACLSWQGQKPWLFSAIYARPCSVKKAKLWEYLNFVASCHQMPWLLAGDFNDILQAEDKVGGVSLCRVTGMKKWFDANNMIDLGFSGPRFTWTNRRVFERIDRAICNEKWRSLFADANVIHLPRTKSDHCPIKICLHSRFSSAPHLRPFRFEAMWLKSDKFKDFVAQQWGNFVGSAWEKSLALVQPLKHWNIHVFGHLRQTKARLLARLAGIQRSLSRGPNRFLSNLEVTLVEEFNLLLEQEALFWQQKSRVKWLQEGDRNTKFFHLTTIIRRRRNKIERLKDENDVWVEESEAIKSVVVKYFSDLFKSRQCLQGNVDIPQLFPCIDDADVAGLVKSVDLQEVKDSLFGIGGIKAPGVDGYPACFYQNQWSLCAGDIFDLVSTVFSTCIIPEKLNTTLITLVPKVPNPSSMVHFRPISLCCTLYKVISKILVARLRVILPNLISPNQVSFVPGRQIVDNIIIAQELMHKFKISKGKKGFMAWKIDLSKAYDRLNWHFIESVLVELKLPRAFIQLVMSCISSVQYKICVNGELTDAFRPQSGIRQGDPLSPYLFVLCIEKLSHIIFDEVGKKRWKGVKSSQSGPCVSHLFFANDLVLFAEASTKQAQIMRECLEKFCSVSGQAVNFDK